jgi:hypothetical protein
MTPSPSKDESQGDELLKLVREHLIDVDQHGYVEGEDDVVASRELRTLIDREKADAQQEGHFFIGKIMKGAVVDYGYYFLCRCGYKAGGKDELEGHVTWKLASLTQKADAGKEDL